MRARLHDQDAGADDEQTAGEHDGPGALTEDHPPEHDGQPNGSR
ncbi:MAG: hypothetical protein WKF43_17360 [Acidimicrobiales bacterium]